MISNSPFYQRGPVGPTETKCAKGKRLQKEEYMKAGKAEQYKKEVKEFGCVSGEWKLIPTDDGEQPLNKPKAKKEGPLNKKKCNKRK
jgi:hypothetical protein